MKESSRKNREAALDWCFKVSRLLDERYFERVQDALLSEEKGEAAFRAVCLEAGLPKDMIDELWLTLGVGIVRPLQGWWPMYNFKAPGSRRGHPEDIKKP